MNNPRLSKTSCLDQGHQPFMASKKRKEHHPAGRSVKNSLGADCWKLSMQYLSGSLKINPSSSSRRVMQAFPPQLPLRRCHALGFQAPHSVLRTGQAVDKMHTSQKRPRLWHCALESCHWSHNTEEFFHIFLHIGLKSEKSKHTVTSPVQFLPRRVDPMSHHFLQIQVQAANPFS